MRYPKIRSQGMPHEQVDGHDQCRVCGELHPKLLLRRVGGLCDDCVQLPVDEIRSALVSDGDRSYYIPVPERKRRRRGPGTPETRRLARAADAAARRRLQSQMPGLFAILRAQERSKRGLEPVQPEWKRIADLELDRELEQTDPGVKP